MESLWKFATDYSKSIVSEAQQARWNKRKCLRLSYRTQIVLSLVQEYEMFFRYDKNTRRGQIYSGLQRIATVFSRGLRLIQRHASAETCWLSDFLSLAYDAGPFIELLSELEDSCRTFFHGVSEETEGACEPYVDPSLFCRDYDQADAVQDEEAYLLALLDFLDHRENFNSEFGFLTDDSLRAGEVLLAVRSHYEQSRLLKKDSFLEAFSAVDQMLEPFAAFSEEVPGDEPFVAEDLTAASAVNRSLWKHQHAVRHSSSIITPPPNQVLHSSISSIPPSRSINKPPSVVWTTGTVSCASILPESLRISSSQNLASFPPPPLALTDAAESTPYTPTQCVDEDAVKHLESSKSLNRDDDDEDQPRHRGPYSRIFSSLKGAEKKYGLFRGKVASSGSAGGSTERCADEEGAAQDWDWPAPPRFSAHGAPNRTSGPPKPRSSVFSFGFLKKPWKS